MKPRAINLRIPGPTPLSKKVLGAVGRQMVSHRSPIYEKMHQRIIKNLQYFFQTKNDVYLLTASGMGGLQATIVNFFSPGQKIIAFTCGEFGNRYHFFKVSLFFSRIRNWKKI